MKSTLKSNNNHTPKHARSSRAPLLEGEFCGETPGQKGQILVYLSERILIMVVVVAVDGWWERINSLKFRVAEDVVAFFQEILGSEVDENYPGFAHEEMSLFMVFWWLDVARVVRSEGRENC